MTDWALPVHTTFSDRDHILRSQECQTVSVKNYMFLYDWAETSLDCLVCQVDHDDCTYLREIIEIKNITIWFVWRWCVFKGDNKHVFGSAKCLALSKTWTLGFSLTQIQTLHDGTIHWALPMHSSFSDLDHIPGSQQYGKVVAYKFIFISY